ncbi:hypothetical protein AA0243_1685 [Novacetimonas hansenii NRIC 0243]|nr:hypothetical protein AA0243_1685 [Novacetimonas hansenii NRIC 0243]
MGRSQQFLRRIFADLAELVVDIGNHAITICNGDNQDIINQIGPEIRILVSKGAQPIIVLQ